MNITASKLLRYHQKKLIAVSGTVKANQIKTLRLKSMEKIDKGFRGIFDVVVDAKTSSSMDRQQSGECILTFVAEVQLQKVKRYS